MGGLQNSHLQDPLGLLETCARLALTLALAVTILGVPGVASAQVGDYPAPYDAGQMLTFNLDMDPADWEIIRFDLTFDIEVPAWFWAEGETPILVSVRRKSADALPSELDPYKISMKVDINEFVDDQLWHGVKKLSLENGDDVNVVTEGFAWYLHRLASGYAGSSYQPGLAAWVRVIVNGQDRGVYLNVEQHDKQFLENRNLYSADETWFYKQDGVDYVELKVGDPDSPSYEQLCYSPFRVGSAEACALPSDDIFTDELSALIDMQAMLTVGAVNAFTHNPDALFSKGKNFYFADFWGATKRMHFPWDLDAAMGSLATNGSIYNRGRGPGRAYEDQIIDSPSFRPLYDQTVAGLLAGPLEQSILLDFLNQTEVLIGSALSADPNNQIGDDVGAFFDQLRSWVPARTANVLGQLPDVVLVGACCDGTTCTIETEEDCVAAGGSYQGDGSDCSGDPCGAPIVEGACCTGTTCMIETEEDCVAAGGSYQGDGSDCSGSPCGGEVAVSCVTYRTNGGPQQTKHLNITVSVVDSATGAPVSGANVSMTVARAAGGVWNFSGATDEAGDVAVGLINSENGCYSVDVTSITGAGSFDGSEPVNGFQKGVDSSPDADCQSSSDGCGGG